MAWLHSALKRCARLGAVFTVVGLAACATPSVDISGPTTVRPPDPSVVNAERTPTGSIFGGTLGYRPLFEDPRARNVGDTLLVNLEERINSTQRNNTSAQRSASAEVGFPVLNRVPGSGLFRGLGVGADSNNQFSASGATGASNVLTGTITVTVMEVLPNGNMLVAGDKQIGTNQQTETVRFSGVVNPIHIVRGNTVSSTQIADARIEYRGKGSIDEAQATGWLTRFFFSFLPF